MAAPRGNKSAAKRETIRGGPLVSERAPWRSWRTKSRHARCIRFVETFCIVPKGAGAGRPMRLAPFQREWIEEVFAPGVRAAGMLLPRGNGKTSLLSAVALWALEDEDDGAPAVPLVATSTRQLLKPSGLFGVARSILRASPELGDRAMSYSSIGHWRVETPHNDGVMTPEASEEGGLQGLDLSLAVVDEIGFVGIDAWGALTQASGKRPRSLVVGIGTPGPDPDAALAHMRQIVQSGEPTPGFVFTEYSATPGCALNDEAEWEAANPALAAGFLDRDVFAMDLTMEPEFRFRTYRLGQFVAGTECWLGEDGAALAVPRRPVGDGLARPTWVGVDVGLKHDSTAVVWCQRRPDGRLHVKARIWHPQPDGRLDVSATMQFLRDLVTPAQGPRDPIRPEVL